MQPSDELTDEDLADLVEIARRVKRAYPNDGHGGLVAALVALLLLADGGSRSCN